MKICYHFYIFLIFIGSLLSSVLIPGLNTKKCLYTSLSIDSILLIISLNAFLKKFRERMLLCAVCLTLGVLFCNRNWVIDGVDWKMFEKEKRKKCDVTMITVCNSLKSCAKMSLVFSKPIPPPPRWFVRNVYLLIPQR